MKKNCKIFCCLILSILFGLSLVQVQFGFGEETFATERVLYFLQDVVKLDMVKYNATLVLGPFFDNRDDLGGLVDVHGKYSLKSETSKIDVTFHFINNTLCSCHLYFIEGQPEYSQSLPSNTIDAARVFLQRYQAFTEDSSLMSMNEMLSMVDGTQNTTKVAGNLTLEVSTLTTTHFKWKNTFNGAVFSSVSAGFCNNSFYVFRDDRSYMRIGSAEVNISREQAISRALEESSKFWYSFGGTNYTQFTIMDSSIVAKLHTAAKDKPLELYPYWMVTLPLIGSYPGFVTMIIVEYWADTGDLKEIYPLGTGGVLDSGNVTPAPSVSPTLPAAPSASPTFASSASPIPSASLTPVPSATESTVSSSLQPSFSSFASMVPSASPLFEPTGTKNDLNVVWLGVAGVVVTALIVGVVGVVVWRKRA